MKKRSRTHSSSKGNTTQSRKAGTSDKSPARKPAAGTRRARRPSGPSRGGHLGEYHRHPTEDQAGQYLLDTYDASFTETADNHGPMQADFPEDGSEASGNSGSRLSDMTDPLSGPPDFHDPEYLQQHLLACLRQANRPLSLDEILRITRLPRKAKKKMEAALFALQGKGMALRAPKGWAAPSRMKVARGILSVQRAGMGFVTRSDGWPDIYIHPSALADAWDGDTVEVVILPGKRGPSVEGRILKVLQRGLKEVAVIATRRSRNNGDWLCIPDNPRIPALFQVAFDPEAPAIEQDDLLLVIPGENIAPGMWQATVTVNLQHEDSPAAQERLVKSGHGVPYRFPPAALSEAAVFPEDPQEADFTARRDLRDIGFVTIDGEDARDFDDAIYVEQTAKGYRLLVAIADVGHYVHQGSALDNEARLRGNSYYFPRSVEPMLPEALSNGLCSLRPDRPRLVMTADMFFAPDGAFQDASFYQGVIRSKARLTYTQVQQALLLKQPEAREQLAPVLPMLGQAESLARAQAALRSARGSLDFDLPEAQFSFDHEGRLTGIGPAQHHFAHRMIEEFMIAANEAVARFLERRHHATLYRIHPAPDPDKLSNLMTFLSKSGLETTRPAKGKTAPRKWKKHILPPTAADLRGIMASAAGLPQEYTINRLVLRAMMQAKYSPENEGHFGLASQSYCHFTSPIRRYADLVVHRSLKAALGIVPFPGEKPLSEARLETIADHINATERTAMEAEREIHKRLTILFLRDKVGERFEGIISSITDFGMFIELPEFLTEGLLSLGKLQDDYYEYLADRQELRGRGSRKVFRLGQRVPVVLEHVNLARQEVDLAPAW